MSEINKVVKYVLVDEEGKKHRKKLITLNPLNTEVDKLQVSGTEVEPGEANVDYINAKTVKNIGGPAILSKSINENTGADYKNLVEEIYGGDSPAPTPVPPKPKPNPNTPEQQAIEDEAIAAIESGEKVIVVDGLNNLTIPADAPNAITVQGVIVDGATIRNESTKSTTVKNEGEAISATFDTKGDAVDGSLYLSGEYNDIYTDSGISGVSAGLLAPTEYAQIHGDVTIDENCQTAKSVNAVFTDGESDKDHKVATNSNLNGKVLTIMNAVPDETETTSPNLEVYAPNASVTVNGNYDEVEVVCSNNTLKLGAKFHANKLTVKKGRLLIDFLEDEMDSKIGTLIIGDEASIEYATTEITASKLTGLTSMFSGKAIVMEDIELTNKNLVPGIIANNHEELDLNGHTVQMGKSDTGCMMLRGTIRMDIKDSVGGGKLINNAESYGVWTAADDVVVNIRGGRFEADTHVMYAQNGTINIYGGEFKMLNADTADRDEKGLLKFLLNCLDASYTAGTAHINVYGGKFYEFNPAEVYGEPGAPISYVAEGYGVVESEEDGKRVFTVLPVDQIPAETPETPDPETPVVEGDETPNQGE